MGLKLPVKQPTEPILQEYQYRPSIPGTVGTKIPNRFLPPELEKTCPVDVQIYNLFETYLPASGHYAMLIATVLGSMCTDERRQVNLSTGAVPTEGKTELLTKFSSLDSIAPGIFFVNFFTRMTFAHYMLNFCGKYLDKDKPVGKELPAGVRVEKLNGKLKVSTEWCEDRIKNTFDVVHAGEGIFTIGDVGALMQLWNGLLDEGFWQGGNRWVGQYNVGSPQFPLKHGIILACTTHDLDSEWAKQIGTMSRTVVTFYYCNDVENKYIISGRSPPKIHITYPNFSPIVKSILSHLNPYNFVRCSFKDEIDDKITENILELIKVSRDESTGKRAMNDRIGLLKGHAVQNKRDYVCLDDVYVVESLLQMCRRVKFTNSPQTSYYYGDKLHFQTKLRQLLTQDNNRVRKEVKDTFKWWDSDEPLYSDRKIDDALHSLEQPISLKVK